MKTSNRLNAAEIAEIAECGALTPDERRVLSLYYGTETDTRPMSDGSIAQRIRKSAYWVRTTRHRGQDHLRGALAGKG